MPGSWEWMASSIARLKWRRKIGEGVTLKKKNPHDETEPPDPEAQADLVEEETPGPNVCMKHPKAILTGKSCDACLAAAEFLRLTDE